MVLAQFVGTVLLAAFCLVVSWEAAYSFLFGGLTCVLPSLFMVWRVNRPESEPGLALKHMVRGEIGKLSLTFVMFVMVFYWLEPLRVGFFFSGLVIGMFCNILMPLIEIKYKLSSDAQNAKQHSEQAGQSKLD
ncbi:MAG: ATP synthase subunit I [Pseudomonadales bacterium]|nr:ATP synthase subunit I [Pseudomonadales bacterium]MDG1442574.1 ATP synthase subunit I [Pseudomonadales bacterium]